jgi:hypothetical protein
MYILILNVVTYSFKCSGQFQIAEAPSNDQGNGAVGGEIGDGEGRQGSDEDVASPAS